MAKSMKVPEQCPMDVGLNILSGKWTLRILWYLSKGPCLLYTSSTEVHSEHKESHYNVTSPQILSRKGIACRYCQKQCESRACYRIEYRITVPAPDPVILKNVSKTFYRNFLGPKNHLSGLYQPGIADRCNHHKIQRI